MVVKGEAAEIRVWQVPVFGVPGAVAFEEQYVVAACGERAQQGAVGGGVAVAPGGGQGQADDDYAHEVRQGLLF